MSIYYASAFNPPVTGAAKSASGGLSAMTIGGQIAAGVAGDFVSAIADPAKTHLTYQARRHAPIVVPDASAIIHAHQTGFIVDKHARRAANYSGVAYGGSHLKADSRVGWAARVWDAVAESVKDRPGPAAVIDLWRRDLLTDAEYKRLWKHTGARAADWRAVSQGHHTRLSPLEYNVALNRGLITDEQWKKKVTRAGIPGQIDQYILDDLRYQIPSPQELVYLTVKEAFNAQLINDYGLGEEFPTEVQEYFAAQGLDWETGLTANVNGAPIQLTWAHHFWCAHWQPLSPTQIYTMWQRLRPGREKQFIDRFPNIQPFTNDDLDAWLKINDYPPAVREWLAAMSLHPLTRIDVERMFRLEVIDANDAIELFMDLGYSYVDAERKVQLIVAQEDKKEKRLKEARLKKLRARIAVRALDRYELGTMDRAGVQTVLGQAGIDGKEIPLMVADRDLALQYKLASQTINAIRRDFLDGTLSENDAAAALLNAGVHTAAMKNYMAEWSLEMSRARRTSTTAQTLKFYTRGLIGADVVLQQLRNLGWNDAEALLYLGTANQDIVAAELARLAAEERKAEAQARAVEAAIRKQRAETEKLQSTIRRITPVGTLKRWYRDDIVGESYVRSRLDAGAYTADEIEKYIAEFKEGEPDA